MPDKCQQCWGDLSDHHLGRKVFIKEGGYAHKGCAIAAGYTFFEDRPSFRTERTFDTGATRDALDGKLSYRGFLDPAVLERYSQYMHEKRTLSDGSLREPDDWKKGIPRKVYLDSHTAMTWRRRLSR